MVPAKLLAQGGQVAMVAPPDEAGPKYGQVPTVLLRRNAGSPAPATTWRWCSRRGRRRPALGGAASLRPASGASSSSRRPRSCCPARAVRHGAGGHGVQEPLGAGHGARELRVLSSRDHGGQVDQDVDPLEGALEIAGARRSALKTSTDEGQPSASRRAAGRTMARTSMPLASSAATTCRPRNPLAPVTRAFMAVLLRLQGLDQPVDLEHMVRRDRRGRPVRQGPVGAGQKLPEPFVGSRAP